MKGYTVGFIFNPDFSKVLLMHKNRPEWQKGRLNGIGGRVEEGESSVACMVREAREETGLKTEENDWKHACTTRTTEVSVDFYGIVYSGDQSDIQTLTDEKIEWFAVNNLPDNIVGKLSWLIPLTIDTLQKKVLEPFLVNYKKQQK